MKENVEERDELNPITLAQQYSDEDKARGLLEAMLSPDGPVCAPVPKPHRKGGVSRLEPKEGAKTHKKGLIQVRSLPLKSSHLPVGTIL